MSCTWTCQGLLVLFLAMVVTALPGLSDSRASSLHRKSTPKPFHFEILVHQQTTKKPQRYQNFYKRQCCHVGKRAARKGYSCYIKVDIALIRINMPMRYKMKTDVHGDKYDYEFARRMELCSKTEKLTNKFNHCCDKVAKRMDRPSFQS